MKRVLLGTVAAVLAAGLASVAAVSAAPDRAANVTPDRAPDFQLTDQTRLAHRLYYFKFAPAIVLVSQTNGSTLSRDAGEELTKLQAAYADKGVLFYMINSTPTDTLEATDAEAQAQGFKVPVLMDDLQLVAEKLKIAREGEVFVLNPKDGFRIAYHGPLDSRFVRGAPNLSRKAAEAWTSDAIDAVLAGKAAPKARVDVKAGRPLVFADRSTAGDHAKISYSKTVAPILEAKCATCHQKGGIGPFDMNSYEVVKGFAPMIRETLMTRRMPPWSADPHVGVFSNSFGLTEAETKTLVHWVDAGAPRGEGEDVLKTAVREPHDWPARLGKPDVVVTIPEFNVPASGIIDYQNIKLPNPFQGDVWVRAIAFKPGVKSVVHHVTSNYVPDPKAPAPAIQGGFIGAFVPGGGVQVAAPGTGLPVPAGGEITYQMHYTVDGKPEKDVTQVGYYLHKTPPEIVRRTADIAQTNLRIPAGAMRYHDRAYVEFPADAVIYTIHAHGHFRGYSVKLTEKAPDGKETVMLSLPRYDFNWQSDYELAQPKLIKAGTKLIVDEIYDNSIHNPANPDPKREVTWGEQTMDEMLYFRVNYRWVEETSSHPRNDLAQKLAATRMMGMLDANADGKVQLSEIPGRSLDRAKFAQLDLNHDGVLDARELAPISDRGKPVSLTAE